MSRHSSPATRPAQAGPDASGEPPIGETVEGCCRSLERIYRDEPYYSTGRTWDDYAPAYRYALRVQGTQGAGRSFEDMEPELAQEWDVVRGPSRLTWPEARPAMAAAWRCGQARARRAA